MMKAEKVTDIGGHAAFADRVRKSRDMALKRLIEAQSPDGSWPLPMCFNAMPAAIFIIMLRTTGLIEKPRQMEIEAKLLTSLGKYQNPDGGFWKTAGEASSQSLSRICHLAMRFALGEFHGTKWPAAWTKKNPLLKPGTEEKLQNLQKKCVSYIVTHSTRQSSAVEWDLLALSVPLVAHVCGLDSLSLTEKKRLAIADCVFQLPGLPSLSRRFLHRCTESVLPAVMILVAGIWSPATSTRRMRALASTIANTQDETGGWAIGSPITMLNIMALVRAEYSADAPVIQKAHAWLLRMFVRENENDASFALHVSTVCNTGFVLDSLAHTGLAMDSGRPDGKALRYLMEMQTKDGGFCFGGCVQMDAEADTTAHVLRAFKQAAACSDGAMRSQILEALQRGVAFLLQRQHPNGGFSCYKRSFLDGHSGPMSLLEQLLFDKPTADVTARVIEVLVDAGMDLKKPVIRKTLRFLLRTQCANGSWWSRWWAGYLVGTAYVLRAYGKLSLRVGEIPRGDALQRRFHAAVQRGVDFLLAHQNADGGWGETIKSDFDAAWTGKGASTPLHTAHILSSLLRAGFSAMDPAIQKAMRFLLGQMASDGRWDDRQVTFTLLSRSVYGTYDILNLVLPLDALNDYLHFSHESAKRSETNSLLF